MLGVFGFFFRKRGAVFEFTQLARSASTCFLLSKTSIQLNLPEVYSAAPQLQTAHDLAKKTKGGGGDRILQVLKNVKFKTSSEQEPRGDVSGQNLLLHIKK